MAPKNSQITVTWGAQNWCEDDAWWWHAQKTAICSVLPLEPDVPCKIPAKKVVAGIEKPATKTAMAIKKPAKKAAAAIDDEAVDSYDYWSDQESETGDFAGEKDMTGYVSIDAIGCRCDKYNDDVLDYACDIEEQYFSGRWGPVTLRAEQKKRKERDGRCPCPLCAPQTGRLMSHYRSYCKKLKRRRHAGAVVPEPEGEEGPVHLKFESLRRQFFQNNKTLLGSTFARGLTALETTPLSLHVKERFVKAAKATGITPLLTYHGTGSRNLPSIFKRGFLRPGDKGYKLINGNAYGPGVYSTRSLDYASGYAGGPGNMLICAVLDDSPEPDADLSALRARRRRELRVLKRQRHTSQVKVVVNGVEDAKRMEQRKRAAKVTRHGHVRVAFNTAYIVPMFVSRCSFSDTDMSTNVSWRPVAHAYRRYLRRKTEFVRHERMIAASHNVSCV